MFKRFMINLGRMTSAQLSNLDFDEEEDGVVEVEVSRKRRLGDNPREGASTAGEGGAGETAARSGSITNLLEMQKNQSLLMEALKQSNDQNKYLRELMSKQAKEKGEEEEYTREAAIVFAFEGKLEDDAENLVNHEVRTGLRPFRGDWVVRWKSLGRVAKPPKEGLSLPQLGTISISPVVIKRMHDRGLDLKLSMFLQKNQDVAVRAGKWRKIGDGRDAVHESFDWKEPDNTQAVAEAVLNYLIALWRIWPEDWSALVLNKVLVRFKYLCNARASKKQQLNLLSQFADAFFGLCAAAGREHKPPPVWRDAEALMCEHLQANNQDATSVRAGIDPYQVKLGGDANSQFLQNRQGQGIATQDNRRPKLTGGSNRFQGSQGGFQGNQVGRDIFNMPLVQLNMKEKLSLTCKEFNGQGCQVLGCKFRHQCSKIEGNKVCLGAHAEKDHR